MELVSSKYALLVAPIQSFPMPRHILRRAGYRQPYEE